MFYSEDVFTFVQKYQQVHVHLELTIFINVMENTLSNKPKLR